MSKLRRSSCYVRGVSFFMAYLGSAFASAGAASLRVPEEFPTLLAAADLAMPGDSILVGPGTWSESETRVIYSGGFPFLIKSLAFLRGGVTVIGEDGMETTVIDGMGLGDASSDFILLLIGDQSGLGPVVLQGLTLRGAGGEAGGRAIVAYQSDGLDLRGCRVQDNTGSLSGGPAANGVAIEVRECPMWVSDTLFEGNEALGAIVLGFGPDSPASFVRCEFKANRGVCVDFSESALTMDVVRFEDNEGGGAGTCISVFEGASLTLRNSTLVNNTAGQSCAGVYVGGVQATIETCTFAFNTSAWGATDILWESSTGFVRSNTFVGTRSTAGASVFYGVDGGSVRFAKNIVAHSSGGTGAVEVNGTQVLLGNGCNVFWNNEGGDSKNWVHAVSDLFVDPEICDLEGEVWGVSETSPCINPLDDNCPLIGAHSTACAISPVVPMSWGRIKNPYRRGE